MPTFRYEISLGRKSGAVICGVDEAGRGPLAGPVVACAAILPLAGISTRLLGALDDSKRLSAAVREAIATKLRVKAIWALGEASVEEIDRFNILRATFMAMRRAFESLPVQPEQALIDGNMKPGLPCAETTVVEGDHLSYSIAAASILAKVAREVRHPGVEAPRAAHCGVQKHERVALTPWIRVIVYHIPQREAVTRCKTLHTRVHSLPFIFRRPT